VLSCVDVVDVTQTPAARLPGSFRGSRLATVEIGARVTKTQDRGAAATTRLAVAPGQGSVLTLDRALTDQELTRRQEVPGRRRARVPVETLRWRWRRSSERRAAGVRGRIGWWGRRRRAGAVAMAALCAATVVPSVSAVGEILALGARNVQIVVGKAPRLDYQAYTASEALSQTYRQFHLTGGYYIDRIDAPSGFATAWHQFQLLNMLDIATVADGAPTVDAAAKLTAAIDAVNTYWDGSLSGYPAGYNATKNFGLGRPDRYVDDNLWLAQLLLRRYRVTGDEAYVVRARQIVDLFLSQRDPGDGATFWKVQFPTERNRDKCVVSTATAIPVLIDVYQAGYGDENYVQTAEQVFAWVQGLRDPDTGLYFDKIMGDGETDTTIYTYVQAEVLESIVRLGFIDEQHYPLAGAVAFAQLTMDHFSSRGGYGIGKFDVIYLRSLMRLASSVDDAALTEQVQQAIALAKGVIPAAPTELPDAAAAASIVALSELPVEKWADLA
jgi:hypothetical protein